MAESEFVYGIDDRPPLRYAVLYGLQWAVIIFPALIIVATLCGDALHLGAKHRVHFLQLTLLTSGIVTVIQSLWGHRYPLLDGPATALLLTFLVMVPQGLPVIQGGLILGGALLILLVLLRQLDRVLTLTTPNVVGVILMLIAFTILPYLTRTMTGANDSNPAGNVPVFLVSLGLVVGMAALGCRLKGLWKTVALLVGIILGSAVFALMGHLMWRDFFAAAWVDLPHAYTSPYPEFHWPALLAFAAAYLAVIVNNLGSIQGVAAITDTSRLRAGFSRGILINGIAGVCCGLLGIVGTVSYSMSPGVILANRVASRFAVAGCGVILVLAAFIPKLAGLLALAPAPVVGAALCVAMGGQIGAGLSIVAEKKMSSRDYMVVGIPVLIGTLISFLPKEFLASTPSMARVFLGNGLVVGIFMVMLLEHVVLREGKKA